MRVSKKSIYSYKLFLFICLYIVPLIFHTELSSLFWLFYQMFFNFLLFRILKKRYNFYITLINLWIINIPSSFISILGTDFSKLPITWFIIFNIILAILALRYFKINKFFLVLTVISTIYLFLNLVFFNFTMDGFKQMLMIFLFIISFYTGDAFAKKLSNKNNVKCFIKVYTYVSFAVAIQIFIQYIFFTKFNISLGNLDFYGQTRVAYSGLFGDNSFVGIYLSSSVLLMIFQILSSNAIKKNCILCIIHLIAILVSSSRTGLYALVIVFVIFGIKEIIKLNKKILVVMLVGLIVFPKLISNILVSRGNSLLDSSGRIDTYISTIPYIFNHFLFGIGLGLKHLSNVTTLTSVPHNYFLQYLLQIGFVGTLLVSSFILSVIIKNIKSDYFYLLLFIVISSMVIPDIVTSRFYSLIIVFVSFTYYAERKELKNE